MHEHHTPETGDPMLWDVLEALAETMDAGPMVTTASAVDFIDALKRRGWEVRADLCRPHEFTDHTLEAYCMACGIDRRAAEPSPLDVERLARSLPDWMTEHGSPDLAGIIAGHIADAYRENP
jgi:hypothetical protein